MQIQHMDGTEIGGRIARLATVPLSGGFGLLFGGLLSLPTAAVLFSLADPGKLIRPAALLLEMLACLVGGFCLRRLSGFSPLAAGLLNGTVLLLLLFGISLLLPADAAAGETTSAFRWGMRGAGLLFSCFGSLLAANAPHRRRKSRHRAHAKRR